MGTSGIYTFFYKNEFYMFSNSMDSYPEGLGNILVIMLKMEEYKKWGEILDDIINKKNTSVRKLKYTNYDWEYIPMSSEEIDNENQIDETDDYFWQRDFFTFNNDQCKILRWDITSFIKKCELIKLLIKNACPTLSRSSYIGKTTELEDFSGKWVYIIDLDKEMFKVIGGENTVEYSINNIPVNWIDFINK